MGQLLNIYALINQWEYQYLCKEAGEEDVIKPSGGNHHKYFFFSHIIPLLDVLNLAFSFFFSAALYA